MLGFFSFFATSPNTFKCFTNIFCSLDKYILQFRQVHFAVETITFCSLDKYKCILQFGQIRETELNIFEGSFLPAQLIPRLDCEFLHPLGKLRRILFLDILALAPYIFGYWEEHFSWEYSQSISHFVLGNLLSCHPHCVENTTTVLVLIQETTIDR